MLTLFFTQPAGLLRTYLLLPHLRWGALTRPLQPYLAIHVLLPRPIKPQRLLPNRLPYLRLAPAFPRTFPATITFRRVAFK